MVNTTELKVAMLRKGVTAEQLADILGISRTSMSYKMTGYLGREFTQSEISTIRSALDLSPDDADIIFFADTVEKQAT